MNLKIHQETTNQTINIILDTLKLNKQALVFASTKSSAEKTAEDISKKIKGVELNELSESIKNCLSKPTKQCERLATCIKRGIAFHHAGLVTEQRRIVEDGFRNGTIKIICCTPTLAYGLDLPAYRTVIKDLKRYGYRGYAWIPVLDYMQMSGRSGRPKYDTEGQAICLAQTEAEKDEILNKYVLGEPETIDSKLAVEPVLRTYILSLISANFISTKEQIIKFFEKTFWAFHFKDMDKLIIIIEKMLHLLEEWEFIVSSQNQDFASADEIIEQKYRATLIGKRVAELYVDPFSANFIMTCLKRAKHYKTIRSFPLLQLISHTNELRPFLRARQKDYEIVQEMLLKFGDLLLDKEPSMYDIDYEDFLDSIKTAVVFDEWISEEDEETILEKYNVRPGELRAKIERADWMLYSTEEIARLMKELSIITEIKKIRMRLRYGVKEELLPLIRLEGIGRARARKLYFNGIKDISDVKKSDLVKLVQILGDKLAHSIKKQVDENIKPIASGKRKGQISIEDYGDE